MQNFELLTKATNFVLRTLTGGVRRTANQTPIVYQSYETAKVVASYGGLEHTQLAAILLPAVRCGVPLFSIVEEFGGPVVTLLDTLREVPTASWLQRKQTLVSLCHECCQGVGIVTLAEAIVDTQALVRELSSMRSRSLDYPGFVNYWTGVGHEVGEHLTYLPALVQAFERNTRCNGTRPEYPELKTREATAELRGLYTQLSRLCA